MGYKIMIKPFAKAQTVSAMLGYVTKDEGLAHYQIRLHNFTRKVNHKIVLLIFN